MATARPQTLQEQERLWEQYAREYLEQLPLEHFMESSAQGIQRTITLASFHVVHRWRPDIQVFNELLLQYPLPGRKRPGQVVPDNMAIVTKEPPRERLSYNLPLESAHPLLVMEYVSSGNARKDYERNRERYERELKVPYYLLFHPERQELILFKLVEGRYLETPLDEQGRLPIPELEMEVALLDGWVRFWYQRRLIALPADLQEELDTTRQRLAQAEQALEQEKQRADQAQQRAEQEKQRADQAQAEAAAREQELLALRAQLEQLRNQNGKRRNGAG